MKEGNLIYKTYNLLENFHLNARKLCVGHYSLVYWGFLFLPCTRKQSINFKFLTILCHLIICFFTPVYLLCQMFTCVYPQLTQPLCSYNLYTFSSSNGHYISKRFYSYVMTFSISMPRIYKLLYYRAVNSILMAWCWSISVILLWTSNS